LYTVGTGASPAAGDANRIYQQIEGLNCFNLAWGTSDAQAVTLSFWVRASVTGTYAVGFYGAGATVYSYITTYTISSANTWTYITLTIPGPTVGTWPTDNSASINVNWDLGTGSTYQSTAGSWTAGTFWATSGSTKIVQTTGATFYITGVQLEAGTTASPFEYRQYGTELALCQRYATSSFPSGTAWAQNAGTTGAYAYLALVNSTTAGFGVSMPFPVQMRTAPTVTYYNPSAANDKWRNTILNTDSASGAAVNINAWGTMITNYQVAGDSASQTCKVHWSATSEL
jgi:hypothetical protein